AAAIPTTPAEIATICLVCTLLLASSAAALHPAAFPTQESQAALAVGVLAMSGGLVCGPVPAGPISHACRGLSSLLYSLFAETWKMIAVVMVAAATPVAIHAPTRTFPYFS